MEVFLAIGAFLAIFMAVLLVSRPAAIRSDYTLAALFVLFGLTQLLGYLEVYNRLNDYPFPGFLHLAPPFILLHGPFLWFYVRSLTYQHFRFKAKYLLHLLPALVVLVLMYGAVYSLPSQDRIALDTAESFRSDPAFPAVIVIIFITIQGYAIWGMNLIRKYKKGIKSYFSELTDFDLSWLRILLISVVVFYSLICVLYILDFLMELMPYGTLQMAGFSFASLFVITLAYFGLRQGNLFASTSIKIDIDDSPKEPAAYYSEDGQDAAFARSLIEYMHQNQPYLEHGLTLADLSNCLDKSPEYLSGVLNNQLKRNFFDFVNHYRVEHFKELVRLPGNNRMKLISLAYDSGFGSKASFNRVFKNHTGITPGQYIQQMSETGNQRIA